MSVKKILALSLLLIFTTAGIVALREYLLLKRIQETLKLPPPVEEHKTPPELPAVTQAPAKIVYAVKRSGASVEARVRFGLFKKSVEAEPALLRRWGTLGWKVLDDIPALCIKNLGEETPFSPLGLKSGECITHIDGETINQPMRNLGIWLTLGSRSTITIETLRAGQKRSYKLVKG